MVDDTRSFFNLRPDRRGKKLVMRQPMRHPEARRILARLGLSPSSVTLGYFVQVADPPGAWAYMPVNTDQALALMDLPSVRDRIIEDMQILARTEA